YRPPWEIVRERLAGTRRIRALDAVNRVPVKQLSKVPIGILNHLFHTKEVTRRVDASGPFDVARKDQGIGQHQYRKRTGEPLRIFAYLVSGKYKCRVCEGNRFRVGVETRCTK